MTSDQRAQLAAIRSFDQLIGYLRDWMGWPIDGDDLEELTFEYTAEELGIDPKSAAAILSIKRLRPLSAAQPWGIFFVEFEPKRLPVLALRRILSRVALKKRASANRADHVAWAADDLLFISAHGADDDRQLTFAHFAPAQDGRALPTLKVLGWDSRDTALHLDGVARELTQNLAWPDDATNIEGWRANWRGAFTLGHREVVTTSKDLAIRLAALARVIRDRIKAALAIETETGPLTKLMKAFREALIHDLDAEGFSDMYAQTIAYGLLSARITDPKRSTLDDFAAHMRTNPFLRELMQAFLEAGGRRGKAGEAGLDFDELGLSDVVGLLDRANMDAVVRDFGDRNPQEDPVIHFYELFLKEYDAKKRMQRGVFYTPQPVVSYIVRSVDELLRTEFGLEDGLADTTKWDEMAKRHKGLTIPEGVSPEQDFVQILDPATGTGTFLVEVIDVIHKTLVAKWKGQGYGVNKIDALWNAYVPNHLLTRLHGYELLMAPYAIAHLKIGLKLYETGYLFDSDERARVYLTNALEPMHDFSGTFEFAIPALAHEADAVNAIKKKNSFSVVIGNPPYSVTSTNSNIFIDRLMDDYKKHVRGEKGLVALSDDYLKFIRLSQHLLAAPSCGVWGMITNHGYLKGVIHRGVRTELVNQFSSLFIVDLHGDSNIGETVPEGRSNENVFDIQQGVAIAIGVHACDHAPKCRVRHAEVWGYRNEKYANLDTSTVAQRVWSNLRPFEPQYFLVPFDEANLTEFENNPSIKELMLVNSCGVKTHRDGVVIDFDKTALKDRMTEIATERRLELLRARYGVTDTPHWNLKDAQAKIKVGEIPEFIKPLTYRPFDNRWIYYNPAIIEKGDSKFPTLRHMLKANLALLTARIQATGAFDAVFVSKFLVEMKTAESSRSSTVFPLYLTSIAEGQATLSGSDARPNLNPQVLNVWAKKLGRKADGEFGVPAGLSPEDIFYYLYAVFYSPGYRTRYAEFLKTDFPRLPLTGNMELLLELARLGSDLIALHLVESPKLAAPTAEFIDAGNAEVQKVSWSNSTVWIDKAQTIGFNGVPEEVWNFHIGGYQVCEKWLKYRKGRMLSDEDIAHYQKIVVAIAETILLMAEIDAVIDEHGGWPGAFLTGAAAEA